MTGWMNKGVALAAMMALAGCGEGGGFPENLLPRNLLGGNFLGLFGGATEETAPEAASAAPADAVAIDPSQLPEEVPEWLFQTGMNSQIARQIAAACPEFDYNSEEERRTRAAARERLAAQGYPEGTMEALLAQVSINRVQSAFLDYAMRTGFRPGDAASACAAGRAEGASASEIALYLTQAG